MDTGLCGRVPKLFFHVNDKQDTHTVLTLHVLYSYILSLPHACRSAIKDTNTSACAGTHDNMLPTSQLSTESLFIYSIE